MKRSWHRLGAILQGLVLGTLLTWALVNLLTLESGVRIFRYQAF